jgi:effector-binding domain-containing protein
MLYGPRIIQQDEQPVLSMRRRTAVQELPAVLEQVFGAIVQYLEELGENPAGAPFAGYFNMDIEDLDVEIGFPVHHPLPGKGEIQSSSIPGGFIATCTYTGPYQEIEPAYTELQEFITGSGRKPTGAAYEFYLNDPDEIPEQELLTKIVFPLESG